MASIQTFINRMVYWCRDGNLGYDQYQRWNIYPGGECDCSSLVIFALKEAGFDVGGATYTGNLSVNLTARGWQRLPPNVAKQPGDILLNDAYHVAAYIGNNQLAQASIDERGAAYGGQSGDQGNETNIRSYYSYPWNCVLRWQGGNDMTSAGDVWNYGIGTDATSGKANQPAWVRLSWIHHDSAALYAWINQLYRYQMPMFIRSKDADEVDLWLPGRPIIKLYDPKELKEISDDVKNMTGYVVPTIQFASFKQMCYFRSIINDEPADERKKYKS